MSAHTGGCTYPFSSSVRKKTWLTGGLKWQPAHTALSGAHTEQPELTAELTALTAALTCSWRLPSGCRAGCLHSPLHLFPYVDATTLIVVVLRVLRAQVPLEVVPRFRKVTSQTFT